jgi:hypothetical protein
LLVIVDHEHRRFRYGPKPPASIAQAAVAQVLSAGDRGTRRLAKAINPPFGGRVVLRRGSMARGSELRAAPPGYYASNAVALPRPVIHTMRTSSPIVVDIVSLEAIAAARCAVLVN